MRVRCWLATCAVIACGHRPEVRTAQRMLSPVMIGERGGLQFRTESYGAVIVVFATYARTCRRDVVDVLTDGEASRRVLAGSYSFPCPIVARDTPVHLRLPGGVVVDGTTDERGEVVYLVPSSP